MKQYLTRQNAVIASIVLLVAICAYFYFKNDGLDRSDLTMNEQQQMDSVLSLIDKPTAVFDSSKGKTIVDETPKMKPESKKKRDSIVVQQLTESPFRGKSTYEIFAVYEGKVNEYLKTKNKKILTEIADFSNDPLFNVCRKLEAYKSKFRALEKKLNGDDDELH